MAWTGKPRFWPLLPHWSHEVWDLMQTALSLSDLTRTYNIATHLGNSLSGLVLALSQTWHESGSDPCTHLFSDVYLQAFVCRHQGVRDTGIPHWVGIPLNAECFGHLDEDVYPLLAWRIIGTWFIHSFCLSICSYWTCSRSGIGQPTWLTMANLRASTWEWTPTLHWPCWRSMLSSVYSHIFPTFSSFSTICPSLSGFYSNHYADFCFLRPDSSCTLKSSQLAVGKKESQKVYFSENVQLLYCLLVPPSSIFPSQLLFSVLFWQVN